MIKKVSINIRPDDRKSLPLVNDLISMLLDKNIKVLLPQINIFETEEFKKLVTPMPDFVNEPELAVIIGGDGTFLRAARLYAQTNTPLFGINRGRLGFLTEFSPQESFRFLEDVLKGDFKTAKRAMLEAVLIRNNKEIERASFINDSVISKGAFSRSITIRLELNGDFLNCYSGDGLIISTATGSTAYSLSAGGPIIVPSIENIYIINPICPHTLAIRPMIIDSGTSLKARIISRFENLLLTIDGQEAIPIEGGDEIVFHGSDKKIFLIPHPDKDYYDILREKLGWGASPGE